MPDLNQTSQVLAAVVAKLVKKVGEETLLLLTPATGKKFRVQSLVVGCTVASTITLLDESIAIVTVLVPANNSVQVSFGDLGIPSAKAGNKLNLTTSAEGAVTATVLGQEDSY